MQCTVEEIEEKRRLAQLRLKNKYKDLGKNNDNANRSNSLINQSAPSPQKLYMNSNNSQIKVLYQNPNKSFSPRQTKPYEKPVITFYGNNKAITGSCSLISEDRFVVELSGYSQEAIEIFKAIPTRSYSE